MTPGVPPFDAEPSATSFTNLLSPPHPSLFHPTLLISIYFSSSNGSPFPSRVKRETQKPKGLKQIGRRGFLSDFAFLLRRFFPAIFLDFIFIHSRHLILFCRIGYVTDSDEFWCLPLQNVVLSLVSFGSSLLPRGEGEGGGRCASFTDFVLLLGFVRMRISFRSFVCLHDEVIICCCESGEMDL
uniref:Uncharacterized protein n=1 Tax=Cucumis sativus TaxID=3659 RepID=A0A0A0KQY6_CUCSA